MTRIVELMGVDFDVCNHADVIHMRGEGPRGVIGVECGESGEKR